MPISHDDIEPRLSNAQAAFRRGGQTSEKGLDVSSADLVQLRKACRLLSGAKRLLEDGYYESFEAKTPPFTVVVEPLKTVYYEPSVGEIGNNSPDVDRSVTHRIVARGRETPPDTVHK